MYAFMIGGICGALELLLLRSLIQSVQRGAAGRVALIAFLKIVILGCAFIPVILYMRDSLLWCGVGVSSVLVAGAFIQLLISSGKAKKGKEDARI